MKSFYQFLEESPQPNSKTPNTKTPEAKSPTSSSAGGSSLPPGFGSGIPSSLGTPPIGGIGGGLGGSPNFSSPGFSGSMEEPKSQPPKVQKIKTYNVWDALENLLNKSGQEAKN